MGELVSAVEHRRFAEHHIFHVHLVLLRGISDAGEPNEVHHSGPVGEVGHETFLARSALKLLEAQYAPAYLYEGHVAAQFADVVYLAAVDVFVRIILEQVGYRSDTQLFLEHFLFLGTYARQILYVLAQNVKQSEIELRMKNEE